MAPPNRLSRRKSPVGSRCTSDGLSIRSAPSSSTSALALTLFLVGVVVGVRRLSPLRKTATGRYSRSLASIGFPVRFDRSGCRAYFLSEEGGDSGESSLLSLLPFDWVSGHGKISGSMGRKKLIRKGAFFLSPVSAENISSFAFFFLAEQNFCSADFTLYLMRREETCYRLFRGFKNSRRNAELLSVVSGWRRRRRRKVYNREREEKKLTFT